MLISVLTPLLAILCAFLGAKIQFLVTFKNVENNYENFDSF